MPIIVKEPRKNQLFLKLRYIFIPLVFISAFSILIFTYLHWYLDYELDVVNISKDSIYWVLIFVTFIIWAVFMRKRLNLLSPPKRFFRGDNGLIHFLAAGALFVPLLIAQSYVGERTASLNNYEYINDIQELRDGDYLQVQHYEIDRTSTACFYQVHTVGKHNDNVNLIANYVIPIESKNPKYQFWIAKHLANQHGTREYKNKQEYLWNKFVKEKEKEINIYNPFSFKYLKVTPPSDLRNIFFLAIEHSSAYEDARDKTQVFFEPVDDDFSKRYSGEQKWFLITFSGFHIALFMVLLFVRIGEKRIKRFNNNKPITEDQDFKDFLSFLIPRGRHVLTSIIIILNVLVFVIMVLFGVSFMHPLNKDLMEFGALRYQEVMEGEYWRLLTSGFVHIGIIHLIMNVFALAVTGYIVEMTINRWRFLLLYFITLIGANINSLFWTNGGASAGASGAIFGLMGWMVSQIIMHRKGEESGANLVYIFIVLGFGGVTLFIGIFNNSNNAAHLGGLIVGVFIGFLFGFVDWLMPKKKSLKE